MSERRITMDPLEICRATELKEDLFGQEQFTLTEDGIKNYSFKQFDIKEFTKTHMINILGQLKTSLREAIEEIQEWQQKLENKWTEQDQKDREKEDYDNRMGMAIGVSGMLMVISFILLLIL